GLPLGQYRARAWPDADVGSRPGTVCRRCRGQLLARPAATPGIRNRLILRRRDAAKRGKPIMRDVLIVVGDASETVDTLYPYYRLQEEAFRPVVIAPERGQYQMVLHEVRPGWTITKEWEGYRIEADLAFREVRCEDYLGIFFSGGRAPEYLRDDPELMRITRHFFDE